MKVRHPAGLVWKDTQMKHLALGFMILAAVVDLADLLDRLVG